ncbi:MAG: hypothetical protein IJ428_03910 [Clostridia bacterium]|nr:hypothetical protein [Clostridia bacterium]
MEFFESLWNSLQNIAGERVELGTNSITTLNIIVWSLFIGFMIAIGISIYNKLVLGSVVSALTKREVFSEDAALTAAELGCANPLVQFALRKNGSFRRIVRMKGDTDTVCCDEAFADARFYLPSENVHRAELIYGRSGLSVGTVLLSVGAFFVLAIVAFVVIPDLMEMLSNFISSITPEGNII